METAAADQEACRYLSRLIQDQCGLELDPSKEALIKSRLGRRMREYGLPDLNSYCDFLRSQGDGEEIARVVDALTTHFTNFAREQEHFRFMVEQAAMRVRKQPDACFEVWSAATASGEEAYTIAMHLAEHSETNAGCRWRVCASDVSGEMLRRARLGIYAEERLRPLPQTWQRKYFQKGCGQWEGHFRVKASLARQITFRQINLIEEYRHDRPFDIIFLRNVLMYLGRARQEQILRRACRFLAPGGHLLIGHSESLNGLDVPLTSHSPSVYHIPER